MCGTIIGWAKHHSASPSPKNPARSSTTSGSHSCCQGSPGDGSRDASVGKPDENMKVWPEQRVVKPAEGRADQKRDVELSRGFISSSSAPFTIRGILVDGILRYVYSGVSSRRMRGRAVAIVLKRCWGRIIRSGMGIFGGFSDGEFHCKSATLT
jgi:hypothetical protein